MNTTATPSRAGRRRAERAAERELVTAGMGALVSAVRAAVADQAACAHAGPGVTPAARAYADADAVADEGEALVALVLAVADGAPAGEVTEARSALKNALDARDAAARRLPSPITIISFGFLHGPVPDAHLVLDLRTHFKDPHVDPSLRHLTARDEAVRAAVLATPGIGELVEATAAAVAAYAAGPSAGPVTVAVGCAGGRHRAATVATALAARLGEAARVTHRDTGKPVVDRAPGGEPR